MSTNTTLANSNMTIENALLTPALFRKHVNSRTPLLIKGGVSEFQKLAMWSPEYIKTKYGGVVCKYTHDQDGRPVRSKNTTTYSDFFDTKSESNYTFTRTEDCVFLDEFTFPNKFFDRKQVPRHIFFSGPANTGALPHEHGDALNFLVTGEKKWLLFDAAPGKLGSLYQQKYYQLYPSDHTVQEWYAKEYAGLRAAVEVVELTQQSTDIVYVPRSYSHTVLNLTSVLGIVVEFEAGIVGAPTPIGAAYR